MRKLSPADDKTSGRVTVPKEHLERDGLVDEDGNVETANIHINYRGPGRYEMVVLDEDLQPLDQPDAENDDLLEAAD
ncbi:MAG: hypothetical protein ABEI57_01755 [Halapricum sp.]